jgi:hypothetical protein
MEQEKTIYVVLEVIDNFSTYFFRQNVKVLICFSDYDNAQNFVKLNKWGRNLYIYETKLNDYQNDAKEPFYID